MKRKKTKVQIRFVFNPVRVEGDFSRIKRTYDCLDKFTGERAHFQTVAEADAWASGIIEKDLKSDRGLADR